MERIYTGTRDVNGTKIYSNDTLKYTCYKFNRISSENIGIVLWGYDEFENRKGWTMGGDLIDTIGVNNDLKKRETIEVV